MTDHSGEFLKCDTPTCDHFEMCPITASNVGKACPKCGANLLTERDFIQFRVVKAADIALDELTLAANPDAPRVLMATHVHGSLLERKAVANADTNPFPNQVPA
jgi:hypothetical protein